MCKQVELISYAGRWKENTNECVFDKTHMHLNWYEKSLGEYDFEE